MCFYVDIDKNPKVKIAEQDIICFKRFSKYVVDNELKSPYLHYLYEMGECYYEDSMTVIKIRSSLKIIEVGLHSYSSEEKGLRNVCNSEVLVKCIIPEGAKYYYDSYGNEYVSNYLIIGTKKDIVWGKLKKLKI